MHQLLPPWAAALLALIPGATALWWGRAAAAGAADAARAERLAAARKRTGPIFGFCTGLLVVTAVDDAAWTLPLLVLARMVAGYYVRRTVYGETWSLLAYLSFYLRLIVAMFGYWLLLAVAPGLVASWPAHPWLAGTLLMAVFWTWSEFYSPAFRFVLRARPIAPVDLLTRFQSLADACALPPVAFVEIPTGGGMIANAVALPSIRRPAAAFTSRLLEELTADEAVAICAHEVAHLEHYRPRIRLIAIAGHLLSAAGCFLVPAMPWLASDWYISWVPLLFVGMLLRAKKRQANETASDLRALALTGNADALISALTKLHALSHIARRWDPEAEAHATHPSLARRIQAIRAAAGAPHPTLPDAMELVDLTTPTKSTTVALSADRLRWTEGEAISYDVAYGHLSELRIVAGASRTHTLRAVAKTGQRWEMTLAPDDVARAQAALDVIDSRLGPSTKAAAPRATFARVAAIGALVVAGAVGQITVSVAALLAIVRPSTPIVAAAAAAAATAAVLTVLSPLPAVFAAPGTIMLLLCGGTLAAAAFVSRRDAARQPSTAAIGALSVAMAIVWLIVGLQGARAWPLHQALMIWPSAATLPAAVAAALAFHENRRLRMAAAPLAGIAAAAVFVATPQFVACCVRDAFVTADRGGRVRLTAIDDSPERAADLPFVPNDIRISPDGRSVAALVEDYDDETITLHVGALGGELAAYQSDEAVFAGNDRVVILERTAGGSAVRVVGLGDRPHDVQAPVALDGIHALRVGVAPAGDGWIAFGTMKDGALVSATGRFGETTPSITEWATWGSTSMLAAAGDRVLLWRLRYRPSLLTRPGFSQWAPLLAAAALGGPAPAESEFWTLHVGIPTRIAASSLPVTCTSRGRLDAAICAAFDGRDTRLFAVDPAAPALEPVATVKGRLYTRHVSQDGWISGWLEGALVALQPRTSEMISVRSASRIYAMTATDRVVAAVSMNGRRSTVRVYARKQPQSAQSLF